MSKKYPVYRQLDTMDCGPSCVRMIAAYHGRHFSLQYLRELSHIDRDGVSMLGILKSAENIGFEAIGTRLPLESGEHGKVGLTDIPLPCMVHWEQNHFVVVYEITDKYIRIADPGAGLMKLSHDSFTEGWIGEGQDVGIVGVFSPTPKFYENEDQENVKKNGFRYLFQFLKPYKHLFLQMGLGLFTLGILQLLFPFLTQAIVDVGIDQQDIDFIYVILGGMLAVFIGEVTINLLQGWILLHVGTRINVSLVAQFLTKVMRLPIGFFDQKSTGDLLQRVNDQRRIELFLTNTTLSTLFSAFSLVVLGIVLFLYHKVIFVIFLISAVVYTGWILLFLRKRALVDQLRFRQMADNQNALIELIQGMPEIKLQQSEHKRRWAWVAIQNKLFRTNTEFLTLTQYQDTGAQFISQLKDIFIIFLAAKAVIAGTLSLGMMLAIQYIIGQMNVPLQRLIGFVRMAQDAQLSLERLGEIHEMKDEEIAADHLREDLVDNADLKIEQLSFAYNELTGKVLEDIDLVIPHAKMTAIVGASGSGKTTLIKLLLGFYEPTSGRIQLGGHSLASFSKSVWRNTCGAVLQDGFIFSDSIANNIAESTNHIDRKRLILAAKTANLRPFIESLPQGFQTKIGPMGNGISQGQRQRLLIARAVYKNPDFLFFDEATNALDTENEKTIVENLEQFFSGRTVVVVAHRLSTVRNADKIVVLEKGRIVEQGKHEELVAAKGRYFTLIKNQLELGA